MSRSSWRSARRMQDWHACETRVCVCVCVCVFVCLDVCACVYLCVVVYVHVYKHVHRGLHVTISLHTCTPYMYTIYVHHICTPYMYTIYHISTPYVYTKYVHNICTPYKYTIYVHHICTPYMYTIYEHHNLQYPHFQWTTQVSFVEFTLSMHARLSAKSSKLQWFKRTRSPLYVFRSWVIDANRQAEMHLHAAAALHCLTSAWVECDRRALTHSLTFAHPHLPAHRRIRIWIHTFASTVYLHRWTQMHTYTLTQH